MLQQILNDMYIDPDLLAELDEEQKQILFCKMREEQIRRWEEREKKLDKEDKKKARKKKPSNGKKLDFRLGNDGNPWVWVMGEHEEDNSIEQILEEEAQEQAKKLAEEETEALSMENDLALAALELDDTSVCERKEMEEELERNAEEEQKKLEEEKWKQEEDLQMKAEQAAIYQSLKEARLLQQQIEEEKKRKEEEDKKKKEEMNRRHEFKRQSSIQEVNNLVSRRVGEIYISLKKAQELSAIQAEETSGNIEKEWVEQEKKSKQAEAAVRAVARTAREEHRRSLQILRTNSKAIGALLHRATLAEGKPPIPKKPDNLNLSSGRPKSKAAVQTWFRKVEAPRGAGKLADSEMAPWFHGIISRQEAESLLENCDPGTFLVRVSERIWGYAISYRCEDKTKHFLVDAADGTYQFFGTNQILHRSLEDLVSYHTEKPVSHSGGELLLIPCGQSNATPDYKDLFTGTDSSAESSYL